MPGGGRCLAGHHAFANAVYRRLRGDGRALYPVHPEAERIEGDPAYHTLADVPDPVDGVLVMVPAAAAAGIGPGAVSAEAVDVCRAAGMDVVDGACPLMWDEPVSAFHRFHRFFAGRRVCR